MTLQEAESKMCLFLFQCCLANSSLIMKVLFALSVLLSSSHFSLYTLLSFHVFFPLFTLLSSPPSVSFWHPYCIFFFNLISFYPLSLFSTIAVQPCSWTALGFLSFSAYKLTHLHLCTFAISSSTLNGLQRDKITHIHLIKAWPIFVLFQRTINYIVLYCTDSWGSLPHLPQHHFIIVCSKSQ